MMSKQKNQERKNESFDKMVYKKEIIKERETFFGKARMRNAIASELFDSEPETEIDDLDFAMF
jgi:hypothetical protein